jgi:hypothetical protein
MQERKGINDVMLRLDLMKRSTNMNHDYLVKYSHIINRTSTIVYELGHKVYDRFSIGPEDIMQCTKMYTLYFSSLYSIYSSKERYEKAKARIVQRKGDNYTQADFDNMEQSYLINFVRGVFCNSMRYLKTLGKNITVSDFKVSHFISTPDSIDCDESSLINSPESFGYKEISKEKYDSMPTINGHKMTKDGMRGIKVTGYQDLKAEEYEVIAYSDNHTYESPEDLLVSREMLLQEMKASGTQKYIPYLELSRKVRSALSERSLGKKQYKEYKELRESAKQALAVFKDKKRSDGKVSVDDFFNHLSGVLL